MNEEIMEVLSLILVAICLFGPLLMVLAGQPFRLIANRRYEREQKQRGIVTPKAAAKEKRDQAYRDGTWRG